MRHRGDDHRSISRICAVYLLILSCCHRTQPRSFRISSGSRTVEPADSPLFRPGISGTIEKVNVTPGMQRRPGQPRSERDAAFLERFDTRMRLPIIVSAILPLIVAPESNDWVGVVVGIATWLVFGVDYVVHVRHLEHYGRTGFGRFDLFVVIATAPWFLLPGAQAGGFVVLLRLARLARLAMATKGSRRLFDRLGKVAVVAGGVLVTGSLVAYYAEHPANPEFATVGDALWWGIVTLTTVGYGNIVPQTATGRFAAVAIMITGIAVLGLLAGALADFSSGWMMAEMPPGHRLASRQAPRPRPTTPRLRP